MRNEARIKALSVAGLILTTMIWGSAFVVMKNTVKEVTPLYLIAVRFTIAGLVGVLVFRRKFKGLTKSDVKSGAVCGFWLALAYILQTWGLIYTTASNNAFLTTFYVIIVPFIFWAFKKGKVGARDFMAAAAAIAGIALLSLNGGLTTFRFGDGLTLLCSVAYAVHIYVLDRNVGGRDPVRLAVLQLLCGAAVCWIFAPVFEGAPPVSIISDPTVAVSLLYLAMFSTLFAFIAQTAAQKHLSSLTVSILLSFECVFGAGFSIALLGDPFTVKIMLGFALMAAAIAVSVIRKPEPS
jgi:drug/metabolite transporter (DMT)-like permease